jgi:hypothetical protein
MKVHMCFSAFHLVSNLRFTAGNKTAVQNFLSRAQAAIIDHLQMQQMYTPDHLLLDSALNIGPFFDDFGDLYLLGNLTNSKIAETKALEPLKS